MAARPRLGQAATDAQSFLVMAYMHTHSVNAYDVRHGETTRRIQYVLATSKKQVAACASCVVRLSLESNIEREAPEIKRLRLLTHDSKYDELPGIESVGSRHLHR